MANVPVVGGTKIWMGKIGVVTEVDLEKHVYRVKFPDVGEMTFGTETWQERSQLQVGWSILPMRTYLIPIRTNIAYEGQRLRMTDAACVIEIEGPVFSEGEGEAWFWRVTVDLEGGVDPQRAGMKLYDALWHDASLLVGESCDEWRPG